VALVKNTKSVEIIEQELRLIKGMLPEVKKRSSANSSERYSTIIILNHQIIWVAIFLSFYHQ
jgi:hypothetical protein